MSNANKLDQKSENCFFSYQLTKEKVGGNLWTIPIVDEPRSILESMMHQLSCSFVS